MKIQVASDLHLEFLTNRYPNETIIKPHPQAELLILAGDIHNSCKAFPLFINWPTPIVYIAGNHEYYKSNYHTNQENMRYISDKLGINYLEMDQAVFNDIRILGCTLWTDFCCFGKRYQSQCMLGAYKHMNDYRLIRYNKNPEDSFSPEISLSIHKKSRAWLENELAKPFDGKTIVVSHHGCHPQSIDDRYKRNVITPAFISNLTDVMTIGNGVDAWIHGHTHHSFNYLVPGTKTAVIANPAGYIKNLQVATNPNELEFENQNFDPSYLIEI